MGANTTADVLHLTNTLTSAAGPARLHLLSGDELRVITRSDEPLFNEMFPVSYAKCKTYMCIKTIGCSCMATRAISCCMGMSVIDCCVDL